MLTVNTQAAVGFVCVASVMLLVMFFFLSRAFYIILVRALVLSCRPMQHVVQRTAEALFPSWDRLLACSHCRAACQTDGREMAPRCVANPLRACSLCMHAYSPLPSRAVISCQSMPLARQAMLVPCHAGGHVLPGLLPGPGPGLHGAAGGVRAGPHGGSFREASSAGAPPSADPGGRCARCHHCGRLAGVAELRLGLGAAGCAGHEPHGPHPAPVPPALCAGAPPGGPCCAPACTQGPLYPGCFEFC